MHENGDGRNPASRHSPSVDSGMGSIKHILVQKVTGEENPAQLLIKHLGADCIPAGKLVGFGEQLRSAHSSL